MRFFEVTQPYYALLKAKNPESARQIYTKIVEGVQQLTLDEMLEMKEVPVEYASVVYSRSRTKEAREIPLDAVVQALTNRTEMILTVDGCAA
ncbi:hypothetical protein ABNX05_15035 [Lysinibacillus sp. M3]|uniref:Uncharacterized protein n=1 Tax=Lysinibacillus zambalensis TaxID=3160866 RepID=A0ABV1MTW1_9BACI